MLIYVHPKGTGVIWASWIPNNSPAVRGAHHKKDWLKSFEITHLRLKTYENHFEIRWFLQNCHTHITHIHWNQLFGWSLYHRSTSLTRHRWSSSCRPSSRRRRWNGAPRRWAPHDACSLAAAPEPRRALMESSLNVKDLSDMYMYIWLYMYVSLYCVYIYMYIINTIHRYICIFHILYIYIYMMIYIYIYIIYTNTSPVHINLWTRKSSRVGMPFISTLAAIMTEKFRCTNRLKCNQLNVNSILIHLWNNGPMWSKGFFTWCWRTIGLT